jgi:hypothetical protein
MILTEEQARAKWCPKALHQSGGEEPAANRWSDRDGFNANPPECRCLASDCMAWRWAPDIYRSPDGHAWSARQTDEDVLEERGYCGLAGQMEG